MFLRDLATILLCMLGFSAAIHSALQCGYKTKRRNPILKTVGCRSLIERHMQQCLHALDWY